MKVVYAIFLLLLLGALTVFAVQNAGPVQIKFFNKSFDMPLALLAVSLYLLGMLTGWSLIGLVRKSINRTLAHPAVERKPT